MNNSEIAIFDKIVKCITSLILALVVILLFSGCTATEKKAGDFKDTSMKSEISFAPEAKYLLLDSSYDQLVEAIELANNAIAK